jgi:hypothetical protein
MRSWPCIVAVAALAVADVMLLPAPPASASTVVRLNGKTTLPNVKAGQVVTVSADPGSFHAGHTVLIFECNSGTDGSGSGCAENAPVFAGVNADGSVSGRSYTLRGGQIGSDPSLRCLPPSASNISAGFNCEMVMEDSTGRIGIAPFFDHLKATATLVGTTAAVTCKKVANVGTTHEKVDFFVNGANVATVTNSNGTVTANVPAAVGDTFQCKGEIFKQKSAALTL